MRDEEHILRLPVPKRRRKIFAMMPLADAMFQLLIFFMLSSNLTPFSMLILRSTQAVAAPDPAASGGGAGSGAEADALPAGVQVWQVQSEGVRVAGDAQERAFDELPELAARIYEASDVPRVVLILERSARVQSLVTVLEILDASGIEAIQIAMPEGSLP